VGEIYEITGHFFLRYTFKSKFV